MLTFFIWNLQLGGSPAFDSSPDIFLPYKKVFTRPYFSGRSYLPLPITCTTPIATATNLAPGTPVRPTSILVVGATGTLGRQVVRRALDEGYDVRCLVRPWPAPADFLRDWGATVVNVDWEGEVALIQCAKAMGVQRYVFFSIHNCDKHPKVPLMEIKYCTEKFLQDSGLTYIIIRLCGFMQVIYEHILRLWVFLP
ncbi:PREDICTED: uncharacterized protein ycf39-like [Nelumbo nucifera]|uniref:Uncharacterized protein ycf39-like n=1 Tax=Nelumbo nucifera TaxID=4432 RepID=A0A1U8Q6X3_NELNU|nr:PREDICTED: uncharacterized protein ycf39-like [Nelumbo nucifera]